MALSIANSHDPPVLLFALIFSCGSLLTWLVLRRRSQRAVPGWPFVVISIVLTVVASLVYLELNFHE